MKYDARLDRSKHISPHFSRGGRRATKGIDVVKGFVKKEKQSVSGTSLSRPWLVLARLHLFFTQVVATATTFAPERRPSTRALRQHPGSP